MTSRSVLALGLGSLTLAALAACAGSPAPASKTPEETPRTTSAALVAEPAAPADKPMEIAAKPPAPVSAAVLDPLAIDESLEASAVPKVEMTPAAQLRRKSRGELESALAVGSKATSVEAAVATLTKRLGKATWVENGKKYVWVAAAGDSCHRLVVEPDGSLELENAKATEWRMLSALAQQNACTGEIRRGMR